MRIYIAILTVSVIIFVACKRNFDQKAPEVTQSEFRAWAEQNGSVFSKGDVNVMLGSTRAIGKLDGLKV